jgi:hypothetical protein
VKGGQLRLASAAGRKWRLKGAVAEARRLRVALVTPALLAERPGTIFDPARLAAAVLNRSVVRPMEIFNAHFARKAGYELPFHRPEWPDMVLTGHRLFHYRLPRRSYRQGKWMDFDGVVGWIEWEGRGCGAATPWLRAAEILHIGQKATFGQGRIELLAVER